MAEKVEVPTSEPLSLQARAFLSRRPSLEMLADGALEDEAADYLGFGAYANALAELIDNPKTATPLTLAISAPWGAGKTSLGKLVDARLTRNAAERRTRPHAIVWFNAWKNDGAPNLGAAFAADISRQVGRKRPLFWRLLSPLPAPFLSPSGRWWRRLVMAAALLITVFVFVLLTHGLRDLVLGDTASRRLNTVQREVGTTLASAVAVLAASYVVFGYVFRAARAVASYVGDPRAEAARGSMDDVSNQLGRLFKHATGRWRRRGRRVVIFVDDLERCKPPRAVEVCEVATQLLAHPNVVIVLLADMTVIAASAEIKYAQLEQGKGEGSKPGAYGRLYLQKLIQIEFALPPASRDQLSAMLLAENVSRDAVSNEGTTTSKPALDKEQRHGVFATGVLPVIGAFGVTLLFIFLGDFFVSPGPAVLLAISVLVAGAAKWILDATSRLLARRAEARIDEDIEEFNASGEDLGEIERRVLMSNAAKRTTRASRTTIAPHPCR